MKKTLEVTLGEDSAFLYNLKETILQAPLNIDFQTKKFINPIMSAVKQTFTDEINNKNIKPNVLQTYKVSYEGNFFIMLDNNMDIAMKKKVHPRTRESLLKIIKKHMDKEVTQQKNEKKARLNMFDATQELKAVQEYIEKVWSGFDQIDSTAFFEHIWNKSQVLTQNKYDMTAFNDLSPYLFTDKDVTINEILKAQDVGSKFLINTIHLEKMFDNDWNYEKEVKSILSEIKKEFPQAVNCRPKGWNKLAHDYTEYDGQTKENAITAKSLFKGMNSGTHVSHSFEIRTSLPHVMYDDKENRIKPLECLVGALVAHVYTFNERNNSAKMLKEWSELQEKIEKTKSKTIEFEFKQPLNQALWFMMTQGRQDKKKIEEILNGLQPTTKKLKP